MKLTFGKTDAALVIGAAGGIGSAIIRELLVSHNRVFAVDKAPEKDLFSALEMDEAGNSLVYYQVDIAQERELEEVFGEIKATSNQVSAIVHCAAIQSKHPFEEIGLDQWNRTFAVNVASCFITAQYFSRYMVEKGILGAMVFITSVHSEVVRGLPDYSSGKAALELLSKEFAYKFAPYGIRINTVAPGSIETPFLALDSAELVERASERVPLGRLGRPDEVAQLAMFLLSDQAGYITGSRIVIDGGLSLSFGSG